MRTIRAEINRREVYRYLGYGAAEPDGAVIGRVEDCIRELEGVGEFRYLVREYPLALGENGAVDGTCFQVVSRDLAENLADCGKVLAVAATLGAGIDMLLLRYGKLSVGRAVLLQAAAAAMIEAYLDELCTEWGRESERLGYFLRPRFSPGYGDFPLCCQAGLLRALEAGKRLGITLTDGLLMMPSKSVTAVIGVGQKPCRRPAEGCGACKKGDCAYRR